MFASFHTLRWILEKITVGQWFIIAADGVGFSSSSPILQEVTTPRFDTDREEVYISPDVFGLVESHLLSRAP
jgi:hypothetical protein